MLKPKLFEFKISHNDLRKIYGGGRYTDKSSLFGIDSLKIQSDREKAGRYLRSEIKYKLKRLDNSSENIEEITTLLEKDKLDDAYAFMKERTRGIFTPIREKISYGTEQAYRGIKVLFSCIPAFTKETAESMQKKENKIMENKLKDILKFVRQEYNRAFYSVSAYDLLPQRIEEVPEELKINEELSLNVKIHNKSISKIKEKQKAVDEEMKKCLKSIKDSGLSKKDFEESIFEFNWSENIIKDFNHQFFKELFVGYDSGSETASPSGSTGLLTPREEELRPLLRGAAASSYSQLAELAPRI